MEFDEKAPTPDEDRRLAEAKKLTLEPLHTDIAPEAEPDAEITARHLTNGPVANAPNDTEQMSVPLQPSKGLLSSSDGQPVSTQPKKNFVLLLILVVAGGSCLGVATLMLTR
jgi:hypothetical protein